MWTRIAMAVVAILASSLLLTVGQYFERAEEVLLAAILYFVILGRMEQ